MLACDALELAIAVQSFGFDLVRIVAPAVATGYTSERQSILDEELAARQTSIADLLGGTATDESCASRGRPPPRRLHRHRLLAGEGVYPP